MDEVLLYRRQARAKNTVEASEYVLVHPGFLVYDPPAGLRLPVFRSKRVVNPPM